MDNSVWIHSLAGSDSPALEHLTRALTDLGYAPCPLDRDRPQADGVLLIDTLEPAVLGLLNALGPAHGSRVCVVAAAEQGLEGKQTWALMQAGAAEVLSDLRSPDTVAALAARLRRWKQVDGLVQSPLVGNNLIGASRVWQRFLRQVVEAAVFTEFPVLLLGESGTGKELVARLIHSLDARPDKQELVILDCTTIMPELSGSEFFGHERGAFTGAAGPRDGAFALADGGTLFLDEVGELPLPMQAQLLRVIQERQYKRVGGNQWQRTNFRLVCATNRVLWDEVQAGRFRADLYYRIATCVFALPPLRKRPDDIIPLARHFFAENAGPDGVPALEPPVQELLLARQYPGNVRELRQLMARVAARHVGGSVTVGNIPESEWPDTLPEPGFWTDEAFETAIRRALCLGVNLKDIGQTATDTAIRIAVGDEEGNLQRAAKRLGVTDRALQMRRANRRG